MTDRMDPLKRTWVRYRHRLINALQTGLLILALLGILMLAGSLIFGKAGLWIALIAGLFAMLLEPAAASTLTLRLYRARPIHPVEAPVLWEMVHELATRAGLPTIPMLYYVPSTLVNAFATGSKRQSAIALTDGLLQNLDRREIAGVIGHEIAHIANGDLRVMGLADYVSRITSLLSLIGQIMVLVSLPLLLNDTVEISWLGLLLLIVAPHLAVLAQLSLSRVREFDADQVAVQLTGDPYGLASALVKLERINYSWRSWLMPGWGNPEPSWLRTHPATSERISRLKEFAISQQTVSQEDLPYTIPMSAKALRPPRWYPGGLWR